MRTYVRSLAVLLWLFGLTGCQWLGRYEEFSGDEAMPVHRCDALDDRKSDVQGVMVRVDVPNGHCLWIDQDEVTVAQYQRWRSDPGAAEPVWDAEFCAWKTSASNPARDAWDPCSLLAHEEERQPFADEKPMRCVDWCDAEAYCRWAGKRLCFDNSLYGTQSPRGLPREWTLACNNSETSAYPWGHDAGANPCNADQAVEVFSSAERGVRAAGLSVDCASQRGTRDLIGNVSEWTYGCNLVAPSDPNGATPCLTKGGSYLDPVELCFAEETLANDTRRTTLGFRCCDVLSPEEDLLVTPR